MGLLDFLRRLGRGASTHDTGTAQQEIIPGRGFAVLDLETTGLSATWHRIVEIAVVRTDRSGRIIDEWVTLVNPQGGVGATHIHGITPADVRRAPVFREVLGEVNARLAGNALVAHNARFDIPFLAKEYERAGTTLPQAPFLCTLDASRIYLPDAPRRRLADLCWICGIPLTDAHSALADARATAHLLAHYLDSRRNRPLPEHTNLPDLAARVRWPHLSTPIVRPVTRSAATERPQPAPEGTLWTLLDSLPLSSVVDEGAPEASQPYLELLYQVLEDGVLTTEEASALAEVAASYSLTREQVQATHRAFLLALAHRIVEDGKVTRDERRQLIEACALLGYSDQLPRQILDEAMAARAASLSATTRPLPSSWNLGEPLRVGDAVAFTGCEPLERARLEGSALAAGLRVTGSVSGRTALLVTDGNDPHTTKARAARKHGTRVVTPTVFATLVQHVQPAVAVTVPAARASVAATARHASDAPVPEPRAQRREDPAAVRAWARGRGMPVGVRGRIPADVVAAYRAHIEKQR